LRSNANEYADKENAAPPIDQHDDYDGEASNAAENR
jgi:hypothetical protein